MRKEWTGKYCREPCGKNQIRADDEDKCRARTAADCKRKQQHFVPAASGGTHKLVADLFCQSCPWHK